MSLLEFPRLYLRGRISWDPIVSNNGLPDYDAINAEVGLRPGETAADFRRRHIQDLGDVGDWNYYGTHRAAFESVLITGGESAPGQLVTDDPLVGLPVEMAGKLVDLDPYGAHTSQIFFDQLVVGAGGRPRLSGRPLARMSSRWLATRRNRGPLPIAGRFGATFQVPFPRDGLDLDHAGRSPLLQALREQLHQRHARGLLLRMTVYATLYFRNGIENPFPPAASVAELAARYRAGEVLSNPAYGTVVGTIGLWDGEPGPIPAGRTLVPSAGAVAPVVAAVDEPRALLSLDLQAAIPEQNEALDKVDFGTLDVGWRPADPAGAELLLGELPPAAYARAAYEARAGMVDLRLLPAHARTVTREPGDLFIRARPDAPAPLSLAEQPLVAAPEQGNVYVEEGASWRVAIAVRQRGRRPAEPVQLLAATFDADLQPVGQQVLAVEEGRALLEGVAAGPGMFTVLLVPFTGAPPAVSRFTLQGSFVAFRALPANADLRAIPDGEVTWDSVYNQVLIGYDAIAPRMSHIIPLGDRDAVSTFAHRVLALTDPARFESAGYMPVTRDLSSGKRDLLRRFCERALRGDDAAAAADDRGSPAPRPTAAPPGARRERSQAATERLAWPAERRERGDGGGSGRAEKDDLSEGGRGD